MMTVQVLLFASYADALGRSSLTLELPEGSTVADVLTRVRGQAGAGSLPPSPLVARNEEYARLDERLEPHDEIAIIPPVAGG